MSSVSAVIVAASVTASALGAATTGAEINRPGWALTSALYPTNLAPGETGELLVNVFNDGAAASEGQVTVTDTLPAGVVATDAGELAHGLGNGPPNIGHNFWDCSGIGTTVVTCTNDPTNLQHFLGGSGAEEGAHLSPQVAIAVKAIGAPGTETNHVTIAGGGAPTPASTTNAITISSTPSHFGITGWDGWFANADGTRDTQAGSHPFEAIFALDFATERNAALPLGDYGPAGGGEVRNLETTLPPGFVGDPSAVPQCTRPEFLSEAKCPESSQIGLLRAYVVGGLNFAFKIYNMRPPAGVPAEFATFLLGTETIFDASVRSGGDYGITVHINNIPERNLIGTVLTLWGVPADHRHNAFRANGVVSGCTPEEENTVCNTDLPEKPYLTLPTSCAGEQSYSIRANTWEQPNVFSEKSFVSHDSNGDPSGLTGCEELSFDPTITTAPDTASADTPAGLTVEVKPSLGGLSSAEGRSSADIQNTTVTLPPGFVINPGQAAGLQACQPAESRVGDGRDDAPVCPLTSKVGTDEIETPLLPHPLQGNVYVLQSNPPELKLLVAASGEGVNLKLVGVVHLNEQTGQLTTKFEGTPELPFTDFKLSFSGGAQAALDTPTQCGNYETSSDFNPWSSPFVADVFPTASFTLTSGPGGGPCPSSPLPFAPMMIAGSTTDQAGGFTNFSLLLQRGDGQQRISGLQFKAPAGLTGELSKVPLCTNAQAESNACPEASKIGHTIVTSGPGPYPLVVPQPGQPEAPIYLTESYAGAPFGLSIVVPLHVGPFVLPTQRVRAKIEINPITTQLTITTDPLPQIIAGVPADLREVDAVIERPEFMINPTNCSPQEFSGTASGTPPPGAGGPGATASISSHFGVGSCQSLKFEPQFSVSTSGRASKAKGASLTAKVAYPNVPQGTDADIRLVKVELPKQLPSRLTTLQKACTSAQFNANPANCPAASKIGMAVVHTPLLPVPLVGPAIFVSHGGEAFPSLTLVLQGDGVTVDLVGTTFINKKSVTSTTFKTVPDQPFSSFELTLPEGAFSALAANLPEKDHFNLCGQSLVMPTEMVGQNGAVFKQSTSIAVTGCAKAKTLTRAQELVRALKVCRKDRNKAKRAKCVATAHKRYGVAIKKKVRKK